LAQGKDFTNRKESAEADSAQSKANDDRVKSFVFRMDNDPGSPTSKASKQIVGAFAEKLGVPKGALDGLSKAQIDSQMSGLIKSAIDNAKSAAERNRIIAEAEKVKIEADKVIEEIREKRIDNFFGNRGVDRALARDAAKTAASPPPVTRGAQAIEQAAAYKQPAPSSESRFGDEEDPKRIQDKYGSRGDIARSEQNAKADVSYQDSARSRDRLNTASGDAKKILNKGITTGWLVGPLQAKYAPDMQVLEKSLATIAEEAGIASADTNLKALANARTSADIDKSVTAIRKVLDTIDSQNAVDEYIGNMKHKYPNRPINEPAFRNSLVTFRMTDPKDKNNTWIEVVDMANVAPGALQAFREKYKAYKPTQTRSR
jgi:hypothetical protein